MTIDLAQLLFGLLTGLVAGVVHFVTLRRVTALYLGGGSVAVAAGLQILRLVVLSSVLVLLARLGALPLLAGALGVFGARMVVVRRPRKAP